MKLFKKILISFLFSLIIPQNSLFADIEVSPIISPVTLLTGTRYAGREVTKTIYQGDGFTDYNFQPFNMLGLTIVTSSSGATDNLQQIKIDKYGTMSSTNVIEMALYYDNNADYYFDPELEKYGIPTDTKISVAQYNSGTDAWYFDNLSSLAQSTVTNSPKTYFVAIRLSTTATRGTYFGIRIADDQSITTSGTAQNNISEINSSTWTVEKSPPKVYAQLDDIAASYQANTSAEVQRYSYMFRGSENIGMLRVSLWTQYFNGLVNGIHIGRIGTGIDADIAGVKIFTDGTDNNNDGIIDFSSSTDGVFNPNVDMALTNWIPFSDNTANCSFSTSQILNGLTTRYFYITYNIGNFATLGKTQGASIVSIDLSEGIMQTFLPTTSSKIEVLATTNTVSTKMSDSVYWLYSGSGTYQAQTNVEMLRLKLATDQSNAVWDALQVERSGTGGPQDQSKPEGRNSDIKYIKIYRDANMNNQLDADDQCISEAQTKILGYVLYAEPYSYISNQLVAPFDLILESTITATGTFPASGSQLLIQIDKEIMKYTIAGSTSTTDGIKPYLHITERGKYGTHIVTHQAGETVKKVDMFDLSNDLNKTKLITLTNPQTLSPTDQTYFIAYDIGDNAVAGNAVGVKISDKNWIQVSAPHQVSSTLNIETANGTPLQSATFDNCKSALLPIMPINLIVRSDNLAPVSSKQGSSNVSLMSLRLKSTRNHIVLNQLNLTQNGTVKTPSVPAKGQGDISTFSIWKETTSVSLPYGDGRFDPLTDIFISSIAHSTAMVPNANFTNGLAHLSLGDDGLYISTSEVKIYITANIGSIDLAAQSTENDTAGIEITGFDDLIITPQTAVSDATNTFPYKSTNLKILNQNAVIPLPYDVIPKIWADPFGDGYPAMDTNADGLPDRNYSSSAQSIKTFAANSEVFLDFNGDSINDLEDLNGDGIKAELDLTGDGLMSTDLNGDGVLDLDFNHDGLPDQILADSNGDGIPEIDLNSDGIVDDYVPMRWTNSLVRINAEWSPVSGAAKYEYSIGKGPDETEYSVSGSWIITDDIKTSISGVYLEEFHSTKLIGDILEAYTASPLAPLQITVESITNFNTATGGYLYVGTGKNAEIMHYISATSQSSGNNIIWIFNIDQRASFGSIKKTHVSGTEISNACYYLRIKAQNIQGLTGPSVLSSIYRVDIKTPDLPSHITIESTPKQNSEKYFVKILWDKSIDATSGINVYEVQESMDTDPRWRNAATVPFTNLSLSLERARGHYYYYRIRSQDCAGNWSAWTSPVRINTGKIDEVVSALSSYPNPANLRSGNGKSFITYSLNQDAKADVAIYDLIGGKVFEYTADAGDIWSGTGLTQLDGKGKGGTSGTNVITWDGKNSAGKIVDIGAYICLVEIHSDRGVIRTKTKIGVK
ncbi:MAG: hypothetical protein A3J83_04260 [Elusimicrobia bacterium RIFOXYA2_FULL_40_6]|nr:MAG: hypothetical protein A3J83_04260 [Elusimicrobia bacterium RIFOXYA2_FULL_40_6]